MSNVTRWNPVRDVITMREAMDRMFEDTFGRNREFRQVFPLPIDATVNEDAVVLRTDVPGVKPEDVHITLEGDTLTIKGEFKNEADKNGQNYLMRERVSGKFERTLTINTPINPDNIEAKFENGLLTITLPKAEAAKPRSITIKKL